MRLPVIRSRRGIIAISTLMISTVLLILIVTLLLSLTTENRLILRNAHTTEALFVAEAGIADATYQLSLDNGWEPMDPDPLEFTFPDGKGKYTIVFHNDSDGTEVEPHESVNNLSGDTLKDGPRGLATVPRKTVDIVVNVEVNGRTERFEAMISRGFADPASVPLLTSGRIKMEGEVIIAGVESLEKPIPVDAGIHSNMGGNTARVIDWDGNGEDDAFISGEVSTTSSHPNSVRANGGEFNVGGVENGQPSMRFPVIDVDAAIRAGRDSTVMEPSSGGTTKLSGKDYKWEGGTINGDLVLDGVNLFVDGDLEVNGTIKGTGALYVRGDTSFRGTAELVVEDNKSLALFSKGHVKLEGFDGSQYLEERADEDPDFEDLYDDAKFAHEQILEVISDPENYTNSTDGGDTWGASDGNRLDEMRGVLGDESVDVPVQFEKDTLGKMAAYLEDNYDGNESADFLVQKLRDTRTFYENKATTDLTPAEILANYRDGTGPITGLLDVLNDGFAEDEAAQGASEIGLQNFNRLGVSYFQGLIYTNGAVYASNEIEIVGALLVEKNGDSPKQELNAGGESLNAGDVFLSGGSSIIYNQGLVEDPFVSVPTGPVCVCTWLGR